MSFGINTGAKEIVNSWVMTKKYSTTRKYVQK